MDAATEFDAELSNALNVAIPNLISEFNTPLGLTTLHVSTMSIGFLSDYDIDINSFSQETCDNIMKSMIERIDFIRVKSIMLNGLHVNPRARKERKPFNNARIIKVIFEDDAKACFNVFRTGAVQVKGCKWAVNALRLCEALLSGIHGFDVSAYGMQVQLINSNFSLGRFIDIPVLYQKLKDTNMKVSYEPENYLGLKWVVTYKHGEALTIVIFPRGSVIITGGKTQEQLLSCYAYTCNHFVSLFKDQQQAPDNILHIIKDQAPEPKNTAPTPPRKRGRKRKAEKEAMYDELGLGF